MVLQRAQRRSPSGRPLENCGLELGIPPRKLETLQNSSETAHCSWGLRPVDHTRLRYMVHHVVTEVLLCVVVHVGACFSQTVLSMHDKTSRNILLDIRTTEVACIQKTPTQLWHRTDKNCIRLKRLTSPCSMVATHERQATCKRQGA